MARVATWNASCPSSAIRVGTTDHDRVFSRRTGDIVDLPGRYGRERRAPHTQLGCHIQDTADQGVGIVTGESVPDDHARVPRRRPARLESRQLLRPPVERKASEGGSRRGTTAARTRDGTSAPAVPDRAAGAPGGTGSVAVTSGADGPSCPRAPTSAIPSSAERTRGR